MKLRLVGSLFCATLLAACGPSVQSDIDGGGPVADASLPDRDNDGFPEGVDCNDDDPAIHPGATEVCTDSIDNNCNGQTDTDLECLSPCDRAIAQNSYFGCVIYAVDLPQLTLNKKYGIIVSNPSSTDTASVTIATSTATIATFQVAPLGVYTHEDSARLYNVAAAGIFDRVLKIESDLPIAAYQFNSLDTINAATTDASLLFAEHSLAKLYYSMNFTSRDSGDGYIAVVATEPDTVVTINAKANVSGVTTATLQPMQVMVVTATSSGGELTGSLVTADKPIAVYSGNRCTNVPQGMNYCDHLEQQIFPRQALGTRYIVGKSHARTVCDPVDYVRVMGDVDGTNVTFNPPVSAPVTLAAGQYVELTISESVEISSDKAFLVGQFLRSSNSGECGNEGDPAFMLQVPVDQFRTDYGFLTPATYNTDFIDVIAPIGASVNLDGAPMVVSATPIANTGFSLTSVVVPDGPHYVSASVPVGVMVYGYGKPEGGDSTTQNVSYAYPAGLDLNAINPVE